MPYRASTRPLGLLRVSTAGSVDDGKSTLIGRLLHDSKSILKDQMDAVTCASQQLGSREPNLALLTDGLRAERERGITIDVAHRFFSTEKRSFILADTPGHAEYTRNMVTGASTSEIAVVLVDVRQGVVDQTRRHTLIASLLGARHVVTAVNKMDLVGWDRRAFDHVAAEVRAVAAATASGIEVTPIPVSALHGDNVVEASLHMPWYEGPTLLGLLETLPLATTPTSGARLHVQHVVTASDATTWAAGRVIGGNVHLEDTVVVLPEGRPARIHRLLRWGKPVDSAEHGHAVMVQLDDPAGLARGSVVVTTAGDTPIVLDTVVVDLCWMIQRPLTPASTWWFKHGARTGRAEVVDVRYVLDPVTVKQQASRSLSLNDIGRVQLRLDQPIVCDPYEHLHENGAMILIDPDDHSTAAAAMIVGSGEFGPE